MRAIILIPTIYSSLYRIRPLPLKTLFAPKMAVTLATGLLTLWTILTLKALIWIEMPSKPFSLSLSLSLSLYFILVL